MKAAKVPPPGASSVVRSGDMAPRPATLRPHPLALVRAAKGMSIDMLAEQAGVGRMTIIRTEQRQTMPSLRTLYRLATTLGVPFESLIEENA